MSKEFIQCNFVLLYMLGGFYILLGGTWAWLKVIEHFETRRERRLHQWGRN